MQGKQYIIRDGSGKRVTLAADKFGKCFIVK